MHEIHLANFSPHVGLDHLHIRAEITYLWVVYKGWVVHKKKIYKANEYELIRASTVHMHRLWDSALKV